MVRPGSDAPSTVRIVGTDADGRLVTLNTEQASLEFWDPQAARFAGRVTLPELSTEIRPLAVTGGRFTADEYDALVSVPVDAAAWHAHLCQAQDRPFTPEERTALPADADTGPPCA